MRTVLYAHDMEPITILELSPWAVEYLKERGSVILPVYRPIKSTLPPPGPIEPEPVWQVRITGETLHRNGKRHMMLFTHNEEHAMLLKAAFLPGQRWTLNEIKQEEFAKGFLAAFQRLC